MRIKSLDLFKAIAGFMIIYLYYNTRMSGDFGLAVCRIAVPFFYGFWFFL